MSSEQLFGKTTTEVSFVRVKSLAESSGVSPIDFIRSAASSYNVSVCEILDDSCILEGDWNNLVDLGNGILQQQKSIGFSREANDRGDTSKNVNSGGTTTCEKGVKIKQDKSAIRKSTRNANKESLSYVEDNDDTVDDMTDDNSALEDVKMEDDYSSFISSEGDSLEISKTDLSIIENMIDETNEPINTKAAGFSEISPDNSTELASDFFRSYRCKQCVFASSQRQCVEEHVKRKHMEKSTQITINKCSVCNRCFRKRSDLLRHRAVHQKGTHAILRCGKKFQTNSSLRAHIASYKEDPTRPKFKCSTCGKAYSTKYVLANHVKVTHKGESKSFKCDICKKSFTQRGSMMTHQKVVHQGEKLYHCSKCSAKFNHSRVLKNHLQNVHKIPQNTSGKETFKCDKCDFTTDIKRNLASHTRRSHAEKSFICPVCNAKFSYAMGLRKHMNSHGNACQCSTCNKVYKDPRSLERHIKTHEPNYVPETVQCELCSLNVANKYVLAIHKRRKHGIGEEISFKCEECDRSFKQKASLQDHMMMHRGQRPWECKLCGHTFTYRTCLKNHMGRHSEESNYMCDVCGKAFKTKDTLRIHTVIHTDPNRYKCNCGKGFTQKQALIRHQRTHSGEKPYLCHLCPEAFNDSSILCRHLQGVHKTPYVPKFKRFKPASQPAESNVPPKKAASAVHIQDESKAAVMSIASEQTDIDKSELCPPSNALSLLASLSAVAEQSPTYMNPPRIHSNMFSHSAYNVMPPESPSMPALIPVTQPCSPAPQEIPQNLNSYVSFQTLQPSDAIQPTAFCSHDHTMNKSW